MKQLTQTPFPKVNKEQWIEAATKQLKGEDPSTKLAWSPLNNIDLLPYYDESDLEGLSDQLTFFQSIKPFEWKLYELINIVDEDEANKAALDSLAGGSNGIIFGASDSFEKDSLFKNILTDICDISFFSSIELPEMNNMRGFVISPTDQSTIDLREKTSVLDQISSVINNYENQKHIVRVASTDFFLEIAAVRALRFSLSKKTSNWSEVEIHTIIPEHSIGNHQWFLNSTAGMASILGGTNSICFNTADGNERITRNVGNVIREESGINSYSDQCGGSYYVEVLTAKIVEESKKVAV